jgi:D-alanyl-D-alanine dipeptidase
MFRRAIIGLTLVTAALWAQEQRQTFKIQPLRPVSELRAAAMAAQPPAEPGTFRQPGLVELVELDPTIKLDIHYASANNFMGTPFYSQARAFLQSGGGSADAR